MRKGFRFIVTGENFGFTVMEPTEKRALAVGRKRLVEEGRADLLRKEFSLIELNEQNFDFDKDMYI